MKTQIIHRAACGSNYSMQWRHVFATLLVILCIATVSPAQSTASYSVSHAFTFTPDGGVTSLPTYMSGTSARAHPDGTLDVNNGSFTFGIGGGTSSWSAASTGSLSNATAGSSATLSPFILGGSVSGVFTSDGSVNANPDGDCCAASSAAIVFAAGGPIIAAGGNAVIIPTMHTRRSTSEPSYETNADPIDFQVTDLKTGNVTRGSLYSVFATMSGAGSFSWDSSGFDLNAQNFDFTINIDSPYTIQQGTAHLQVTNGAITTSDGTGMFAGIFPAVGSSGNFAVPFNNDFSLDYNLGNFNGDPLDVQFTLSNGGSACIVPEPSSMLLLGSGLLSLSGILRRRHSREVREPRSLAE